MVFVAVKLGHDKYKQWRASAAPNAPNPNAIELNPVMGRVAQMAQEGA